MSLCKRTELRGELPKLTENSGVSCFLFFGERFLCKQASDELITHLLSAGPGTVHAIDGDEEDSQQTLGRLLSFSLLPGLQIYRVSDSQLFGPKKKNDQIWPKVEKALLAGNQGRCARLLTSMLQSAGLDLSDPPSLQEMSKTLWKEKFGFEKPGGDLSWSVPLLAGVGSRKKAAPSDLASQYLEVLKKGLPKNNILLLTASSVDKRKSLFTFFKKNGLIVDCSVDEGGSSAAQSAQKDVIREMMGKTLKEFHKSIEPKGVEIFFQRVGFHPVAVVTETEKLCHFVGDSPNITVEDLEEMVANNREGALFELTDAFGKRQTGKTLTILSRLLDQNIHGLAILATMRNFLRRMLQIRAIQNHPEHRWQQGMNARQFQNHYLAGLKASGQWGDLIKGHPYALYMNFTCASRYSLNGLKRWMVLLLNAEYRLKGSPVPQKLVLEELFLAMLKGTPRTPNNPSHSIY